jgi:aspartyl-tRNA(Asn)/glutamyl-tRNA(Gln) amidotransferase subunit A
VSSAGERPVDALHMRPVAENVADVLAGRSSAIAVVRSAMAAIVNGESGPERLNAFVSFDYEAAVEQARAVDERVRAGERPPLAGVPVAVKDNICTVGLPTTCGSPALADYWSPYDATVVRRLRAAGAVIVGKTNLDEFAMGSSTETSALGATRNPRDYERVAGGSSGGSAAAVAAGLVPAALGSDTGGSVRLPAAFCGVAGVRPSYGMVSRYGLVAHASSLDQVGVLARSTTDAAHVLQAIAGSDPYDATCSRRATPDFTAALRSGADTLRGTVIGVPVEYLDDRLHADVRRACDRVLDKLRAAGAALRRVSLPHTRYALPAYYVIASAEASTNLARFDGVRYGNRPRDAGSAAAVYERSRSAGFGSEVKRRIILGTFALSAGYSEQYYGTAERVRTLVARDFEVLFADGVDVLFTPTVHAPAFRLRGAGSAGGAGGDPYDMYLTDAFTVAPSLAALPALSLPIGAASGLPIGGQLIGARWADAALLGMAAAVEAVLGSPDDR